ncbi:MAG TPA: 1,4-dihydroxy-2-naphthoate octaprenyltransferase [Ktedonobacterales bacterium]|nr:1,4-dihydroxy-2-naphthoate octaprenyltransferase [Ktedonobacterales bacterium]
MGDAIPSVSSDRPPTRASADTSVDMAAPTSAGVGPARPRVAAWRVWLRTARPVTLAAAVSPILVGTALAGYQGAFSGRDLGRHWLLFAITLLAGVLLQVGVNYFNEYFDHRYGLDTAQSLGASTVIFRGEMTSGQVFGCGVASFALATALGIALIALVGPAIILFGLAALLIGYFYSARPFALASRGLGDIMVYLAMGFLMTWGAYYVQLRQWSWVAFAASVPVGLLVTAILNMNNVRDYQDDLAVGKQTLPVRFGLPFGRRYHAALLYGAYVTTTVFVIGRLLPWPTLLVWLTFPLAYANVRSVLTATGRKAYIAATPRTAQLHLLFGVALALGALVATLAHV